MPEEAQYLWDMWLSLASSRQSSGYGPQPLSWQEIEAWQRLYGFDLQPWELDVFRELDSVYLSATSESIRKSTQAEQQAATKSRVR